MVNFERVVHDQPSILRERCGVVWFKLILNLNSKDELLSSQDSIPRYVL